MGKGGLSAAEKLHLRQQMTPPRLAALLITLSAQMANTLNTDYLRRWAGIAGKGSHTVGCLREAWRLTFLMQDFLPSMSASS